MARQDEERDTPINLEEVDVVTVADEVVEINLTCDNTTPESVQVHSGPDIAIGRAARVTVASRVTRINFDIGSVRVQEITDTSNAFKRFRQAVQDFLVATVEWPDQPEANT